MLRLAAGLDGPAIVVKAWLRRTASLSTEILTEADRFDVLIRELVFLGLIHKTSTSRRSAPQYRRITDAAISASADKSAAFARYHSHSPDGGTICNILNPVLTETFQTGCVLARRLPNGSE